MKVLHFILFSLLVFGCGDDKEDEATVVFKNGETQATINGANMLLRSSYLEDIEVILGEDDFNTNLSLMESHSRGIKFISWDDYLTSFDIPELLGQLREDISTMFFSSDDYHKELATTYVLSQYQLLSTCVKSKYSDSTQMMKDAYLDISKNCVQECVLDDDGCKLECVFDLEDELLLIKRNARRS